MAITNCIKHLTNRLSLTLLALAISAASSMALDLPIKKVKGKEYYYYKVEKGETVYSLCRRFGMTHDEMEKYNPWITDGLKTGKTMYFPVSEFGNKEVEPQADTSVSIPIVPEPTAELTPVNPPIEVVSADTATVKEEPAPVPVPEKLSDMNVAICLPFILSETKLPKAAIHATDFYRGFLLGMDSLHVTYGNPPVKISVIDTGAPDKPFSALADNKTKLSAVNIIIAPDAPDRLEKLGEFGLANNIYVFNTTQSRDTTWMTNPYMLQGNITSKEMYQKAIDKFIADLDGATPVFLINDKGKKDKQDFVVALCVRLGELGIDFKPINYTGALEPTAILNKLPVENANYVFVPISGTLEEFNKFGTALTRFKTESLAAETPGKVRLFAFPEYVRFTGDPLEKLKTIGTTFYTRFYNDPNSIDTETIKSSMMKRFGIGLPEGVPNQALYGFDVARWLLSLAARGGLTPATITGNVIENGAQSAYRFEQAPDGGFVNNALFFVTLNNEEPVRIEVL